VGTNLVGALLSLFGVLVLMMAAWLLLGWVMGGVAEQEYR